VELAEFLDEEMSGDRRYPVETQLALLRRDIEEILQTLNGNGRDKKGLVSKVDELMTISDRGRYSLRVALWVGGAIVAVTTAVAQFKTALFSIFGFSPPPGH
jgi:hypothetical protein